MIKKCNKHVGGLKSSLIFYLIFIILMNKKFDQIGTTVDLHMCHEAWRAQTR